MSIPTQSLSVQQPQGTAIDWSQLCILCNMPFHHFPVTTLLMERGVVTVSCGHTSHPDCIVIWHQGHENCPACAVPFLMVAHSNF